MLVVALRVGGLSAPFTGLAAQRCRPAVDGGCLAAENTALEPPSGGFSLFGFSHSVGGRHPIPDRDYAAISVRNSVHHDAVSVMIPRIVDANQIGTSH